MTAPTPTRPDEPNRRRRRRVLTGVVAAWAVLLTALAVVSYRTSPPTVREQRPLSDALRIVDEAMGTLLTAGSTGAVPVLFPDTVDTTCRITPMRDGTSLTRTLRVYTTGDAGPELLDRLSAALPASYEVETIHRGDRHALRADAGGFVAVKGEVIEPGVVAMTASTGCRPTDTALTDNLMGIGIDAEPARLLGLMGAATVEPTHREVIPCPAGGAAYTTTAVGRGVRSAPSPRTAMGQVPGAVELVNTDQVYAYRQGDRGVVVTKSPSSGPDGDVRVSVTQLCR